MDAIDAARAVVEEHHPDARAAFLGGSVVTARRTAMSDLDIVVVLRGAPAPYRASLRHDGWPVELFVHTEATWYAYVEREVRKRRSPLLWMCAAGLLLFDTDGVGARIAADARKLTAAGPPGVSAEEIDDRRYAITDLLDDLSGSTDQGEQLFIATELARRTGELALAIGGSWNASGKWLARSLDTTAPGLGLRLHHAVHEVLGVRSSPSSAWWTRYSGRPAAGSGPATGAPAQRRERDRPATGAGSYATLTAEPPLTRPALTVVPRSGAATAAAATTNSDRARIALAPSCGASPACDSTPVAVTLKIPVPLRAVFTAPCAVGSSTSVVSAFLAVSSIHAPALL